MALMTRNKDDLEKTKAVMAILVQQPPKPHGDMKLGKARAKRAKSPKQKKTR